MDELSPKELYDQRKKEKFGSEKKSERFGKFKKLLIWLLVILIVSGGIFWLIKRSR